MAKCAVPSASLLHGVTYLGAPGASASGSPGLYDPSYSASAGETMVTSRPAASYRPLSLATKNPRWLPLGVQSSATVIFDDMSWSGAARSGAVDNHDVVTVVDDILKRFLGATPKPRRRLVAAAVANALRESAAESAKRAKESRGIAPASLLDDARYEPRALRALRLGFNGVTEIGARALADALIAVRESARDALGEEAARDACVVRELDLACNAVGAAGARALGTALDSGVEEIDLGNNALGDEGAKCVAKALKENASTRKVLLAGNDIGAEGAWWIADAMCVNADVRWLDLGSNRVGDGGAEDIAEELKTNAGVQFLDLRRNDIGARGAEALADAAEANDGLTGVCLRGNRVDARCQANVRARVGLRVDVEMQRVGVGGWGR